MSKQFTFSTHTEVELFSDKMIVTTSLDKTSFDIKRIKEVFMTRPTLLSKGYIEIDGEYLYFKRKDLPQVISLLDYLERLGALVVYLRKECTDTYVECSVSVGGVCSFLKLTDDSRLIYYPFSGKVAEIDVDSFKYIVVSDNFITFAKSEDYFHDTLEVNGEAIFFQFKKKYHDTVLDFVRNVIKLNPSKLEGVTFK